MMAGGWSPGCTPRRGGGITSPGAEGRRGEDLVVVGREGSLQLPPEYHALLPPGSRVRVEALEDGVALRKVEP